LTIPPSVALYATWVGTTAPFVLNSLQTSNFWMNYSKRRCLLFNFRWPLLFLELKIVSV
jgi:hypothetical protein